MSGQSANEFLQLARAVAHRAFARACEARRFDEFAHERECAQHLWETEGQPLLATAWYALHAPLRETPEMRGAARRVMGVFLETFDERPPYGAEELADEYVTQFTVSNVAGVIQGPAVYHPQSARRAEDERPFDA